MADSKPLPTTPNQTQPQMLRVFKNDTNLKHEIKASKITLYGSGTCTLPAQRSGLLSLLFKQEFATPPYFTYTFINDDDLDGLYAKIKVIDTKHVEIFLNNTTDSERNIYVNYKAESC